MGSCVSQPAKVITKKYKEYLKPIMPKHGRELEAPGRKSIPYRNLTVIANPTPGNFSEKYCFDGKELGRGEFGTTYRCFEMETEKAFACKIISKSKLRTEIDVEDVRREVQIMLHLPKHPNIVSFKDVYEDLEAVYIIMELCEGGELFDRIIAKGHYSELAAANVTKTIMDVCKVCHEYGVIHRDLKPENFLFADASENSQLRAIDFGLSTFFEPGQTFDEVVGSPYYMAPEVLRRNYGQQVDIWSAGVILYILLCGVPPFWAETEGGIAQAIIRGELDFERDPWPRISESAKDLVRSMLDPNPYTRLTVKEVLEHPWIKHRDKIRNVSLGDNVRQRIKQFYLMNKFKKKVLTVVVDMLPEEQIDILRETFDMMDTDCNGHLTLQELKDGLSKIGHPIPDHDVKMLMEAADADGTGTLDCEEFLAMSLHLERIACDDYLSQAFAYFDKNRTGYIEFEELREALLDDNPGSNNDQVIREIMFDVDLNKDGRISYEEFKAMMKTGMDWKMSSRQYSRAMLSELSLRLFSNKFSRKLIVT